MVFVQCGSGVDQHGTAGAKKAVERACRNAIEFNALPYMEQIMKESGRAGREDMLIHVKVRCACEKQARLAFTDDCICYVTGWCAKRLNTDR